MRDKTARRLASAPPRVARATQAAPETNLTRIAYDKIRAAIVYARFDLGEPLSENELAKALGMSKAPIRGAMTELRLKGLVEIVPQSGSYVFSPTREEIEALCDFRLLLELQAVSFSMLRQAGAMLAELGEVVERMRAAFRARDLFQSKVLDTEFHHTFIRHSGNHYLIESYDTITHTVEALRYRVLDTDSYRNKGFEEHQKMLELLKADKVGMMGDVLSEHISRTKQFQANVPWGSGRSLRRDYKFRDCSDAFRWLEEDHENSKQ